MAMAGGHCLQMLNELLRLAALIQQDLSFKENCIFKKKEKQKKR